MARKPSTLPLNIPRETEALSVYVPMSDRWYPAWIERGQLVCIACRVMFGLRIRLDASKTTHLSAVEFGQLHRLLRRYRAE